MNDLPVNEHLIRISGWIPVPKGFKIGNRLLVNNVYVEIDEQKGKNNHDGTMNMHYVAKHLPEQELEIHEESAA